MLSVPVAVHPCKAPQIKTARQITFADIAVNSTCIVAHQRGLHRNWVLPCIREAGCWPVQAGNSISSGCTAR